MMPASWASCRARSVTKSSDSPRTGPTTRRQSTTSPRRGGRPCRSTQEECPGITTRTAWRTCTKRDCRVGEQTRPEGMEEASRLPWASASRERLPPIQATHRRQAERSKLRDAGNRARTRHQRTQSNARARSPTVRTHPQLTEHRVGALRPEESCNSADSLTRAAQEMRQETT